MGEGGIRFPVAGLLTVIMPGVVTLSCSRGETVNTAAVLSPRHVPGLSILVTSLPVLKYSVPEGFPCDIKNVKLPVFSPQLRPLE